MGKLTFGFIGIGLIGGSIAKSLRKAYPDCEIIVYDHISNSCSMAISDKTATSVAKRVDESFCVCDYIFLCTPVQNNLTYLKRLKSIIRNDCIITDVGSVKGNIQNFVRQLSLEANFIGGHPMTGSEKSGYEYCSEYLLENAYYAITPTEQVSEEKVTEFTQIVSDIGALPIRLSDSEHDRIVAAISHLPHIIASCLVNLVKHNDSEKEYMKMIAAGGFKDITRIASSSPEMWEQICMTNTENISEMLQLYIDELLSVKQNLNHKDGRAIFNMVAESRDYRDNLDNCDNSLLPNSYDIYCDIVDESGAIATIATILATNHISIKNIGIIHNREFESGVLKISFYDRESIHKAIEQLEKHRYQIYGSK